MAKTLPTLFKKPSKGELVQWDISVQGNKIVTRWGRVGGAVQETVDVVAEGKNQGRVNETTPAEQAVAEAEAKWVSQKKKGYLEDSAAAAAGKVDKAVIQGGYSPMLAHRYDQHAEKIRYPCAVQPKMDGHRCTSDPDDDCSLWSRTRKPILSMPHIVEELRALKLGKLFRPDGELYNHEIARTRPEGADASVVGFEYLTSLIRAGEPREGHDVVEYHVYDVNMPGPFRARLAWLRENIRGPHLKVVETIEVANEDEMLAAFEHFLEQGFEGLMVRNLDSPYEEKRSYHLQKVKEFQDSEYEVVGVEEGRGKLAGHAIFVLVAPGAGEFRAKMKGAQENLRAIFQARESYVGRMVTVKYQGLSAAGIPRFPVALRVREDV